MKNDKCCCEEFCKKCDTEEVKRKDNRGILVLFAIIIVASMILSK